MNENKYWLKRAKIGLSEIDHFVIGNSKLIEKITLPITMMRRRLRILLLI